MGISGSSTQKGTSEQRNQSIGVYLCKCRGEISDHLDLDSIAQGILKLPSVGFVELHEALCSPQGCAYLRSESQKRSPSRVIIGACSPESAETSLGIVLEEVGLNKYLCSQVDLREQCGWVHPEKGAATAKAFALMRGGILSLLKQEPLQDLEFPILPSALVIGAEPAGVQAAVDIAEAGFKVCLVDLTKGESEGGCEGKGQPGRADCEICSARYSKECTVPTPKLTEHAKRGSIEVLSECLIEEIEGVYGHRHVKIRTSQGVRESDFGTVLVAAAPRIGSPECRSELLRSHPDVVTSLEFEKLLDESTKEKALHRLSDNRPLTSVSFLQSPDGRACLDEHTPRGFVCHGLALYQAIRSKQLSPETEVHLYICDPGRPSIEGEKLQDIAVREGIHLTRVRCPVEIKSADGKTCICATDDGSGAPIERACDMVVVPVGQTRSAATERILNMLHMAKGIDTRSENAGPESPPNLHRGICVLEFSLGAMGPTRAIDDGQSAAAQMIALMNKQVAHEPRIVARVEEFRCRGCGKCEDVCEYGAISLVEKEKGEQIAKIDELRCEGCGLCRVACCNGSMALLGYTTTQLLAEMLGIIGEVDK